MKHWLIALPIVLGIASCTVNDNPAVPDESEESYEVDPSSAEFSPEVLLEYQAFVSDNVDADVKKALQWGVKTVTNQLDGNSQLYVLSSLNEIGEEQLKEIYQRDAEIVVVNPVKAELEAYDEAHDWMYLENTDVKDTTFVYAFSTTDRYAILNTPSETVEDDPVVASMERPENLYVSMAAWLDDLNRYVDRKMNPDDSGENDGKLVSLEDLGNHLHIHVNYPDNIQKWQFRKVLWSDADVLKGYLAMSAIYDIYTVHVYEGEQGAGNYYGVRMAASLSSDKVWKGKGRNKHGGVYVRWVGAYAKQFKVESHLIGPDGNYDDNLSNRISFTAGGYPSPPTTVGSTTYQYSNNFSLDLSVSGSYKSTSETAPGNKKTTGSEKQIQASMKTGWSWTHSEQRVINDADIQNTWHNDRAGWAIGYENLPIFSWSEQYGYKITPAKAYRSTMTVEGSWLWYDPNGKDNDDSEPLQLATYLECTHGIQSFISTKADHREDTYTRSYKAINKLNKVFNKTIGALELKNNLKNGMTIHGIEIKDAVSGEVYSVLPDTYQNGETVDLGGWVTSHSYMVSFMAKQPGGVATKYTYTLNPRINLSNKKTITLYALDDFTAE